MVGNGVRKSRKQYQNKKSREKKKFKKYHGSDLFFGGETDTDIGKYLIRITEIIENIKSDKYEMKVMAGNVLNEIRGNEITYAQTGIASKLFEVLLPFASDEEFSQFIKPFLANLRPVFSDRSASHVLECIVTELFRRFLKHSAEKLDDEKEKFFYQMFFKISKFALNNIENFMWDISSNHILRTVLSVLSGIPIKGKLSVDEYLKIDLPDEFKSLLEKYAYAIVLSPHFSELCYETLTSALIQILLLAVKDLEEPLKAALKKITVECNKNHENFKDNKNMPFWRIIEVALEVANEKQFNKFYKLLLCYDLNGMAISKSSNFTVQKLIKFCKTKEQFETIFDKLQENADKILKSGNTGVILEMAQGCVKFKTKQGEFVKMILRILQCKRTFNEDSDISPLTCYMVTSDKYNPETMDVNLHGSLIVQAMLNFAKPVKVINSLLNMDTKQLLKMLSDFRGCHIVEAFIQSSFVGEKSRDRLFKKLIGNYTQLATSKHGSYSLENIWSKISTKNKVILMNELRSKQSELTSNQFGRLIAHKINLNHFRRNKTEWLKIDSAISVTKKCFSDMIDDFPTKRQKLT